MRPTTGEISSKLTPFIPFCIGFEIEQNTARRESVRNEGNCSSLACPNLNDLTPMIKTFQSGRRREFVVSSSLNGWNRSSNGYFLLRKWIENDETIDVSAFWYGFFI